MIIYITWLIENRQAKIRGLKLGVLIGGVEEEILRLEITVHDSKRMASLDHTNNRLHQLSSLLLTVMALLHDAVEELAAAAQLHDQMHEHVVLEGALDPHDARVFGEMVHDLDLPPHVVAVFLA